MKILVSIPVHEKPDVINDMLQNIKKYIPNSIIILHISYSFYDCYNEDDIIKDESVIINPKHLKTSWGNIYQTHICNFLYACQIVDFDYILLQASNDMFINFGIQEYMEKYTAGFNRRFIWQDASLWWPAACAVNDITLKKIMTNHGITRIVASQVEGSFYKKNIFATIANILVNEITEEDEKNFNFYSREEVYFSTIASKIVDFSKCGYPTTFSEVHRFDGWMFAIRKYIYKFNTNILKNIIPQYIIEKLIGVINKRMFESRFYKIRRSDIDRLKSKKEENSFLNDWPGYFQLYNDNIFSVKRIEREYSNNIRTYIREID